MYNNIQVKQSNKGNPIFTNTKSKIKTFYLNNAKDCKEFYPNYKCVNYDQTIIKE